MSTRAASTTVKLELTSTITNTLSASRVAAAALGKQYLSATLATGVSANQANRVWEDTDRSLISDQVEDIDLYAFGNIDLGAGLGKDALGQTMAMEEVVIFMLQQTGGTGRLEVMPSNPVNYAPWIPSLTVAKGNALKSGGILFLYQPDTDAFDVEKNVSSVMRLHASGGTVTYNLVVVGRHDDEESSSSTPTSTSKSTSSLSTTSVTQYSYSSASSISGTTTSKSTTSQSESSLTTTSKTATTATT